MTIPMAIPMAIKTYSMEVFPESSFVNRFTRWSMGFTRVLTPNENCYSDLLARQPRATKLQLADATRRQHSARR
jgi:uncharacterized protein (DUF2235 family)